MADATPRVPDIFVVGAPKAATSSLHLYLRAHPGVFMCSPKEPHFFSTDLPGLAEVESRAAYDALFAAAPAGALCGEASAFYLASETAAKNILAANPEARIVLSIREPVSASISWYHQLRDGFREDQSSFAASWDLQEARARGERLPPYCPERMQLQYRAIYDYAPQIARYFDAFGRDRVKVFRFERIKADPGVVAADLLAFLGLSPLPEGAALGQTNVRRRPLVPGLTQFLAAPPRPLRPFVAPAKRALNALGLKPSELVMKHFSRPAGPAADVSVTPETRARVRAAFVPTVDRLETLLDEDFSAWRA
jgi:hypothetical protein